MAPSGVEWEPSHGARSNPPYARPVLQRWVVSEPQGIQDRMGNCVPKPFQGFGISKVRIPRSFPDILGQRHGPYLMLLHEYGIAAVLAGIYDDNGTTARSSPHFYLARGSQEALKPRLSFNLGNQLIELVARVVAPIRSSLLVGIAVFARGKRCYV